MERKSVEAVPALSAKIDFTGLSRQGIEQRISGIIWDAIEEMLGFEETEIQENEFLSDYGMDSVAFLKLIDRVERETGIEADRDRLFDLKNRFGHFPVFRRQYPRNRQRAFRNESPFGYYIPVRRFDRPLVLPVRGTWAVIGMACRFPGAENIDEFWEKPQKRRGFGHGNPGPIGLT